VIDQHGANSGRTASRGKDKDNKKETASGDNYRAKNNYEDKKMLMLSSAQDHGALSAVPGGATAAEDNKHQEASASLLAQRQNRTTSREHQHTPGGGSSSNMLLRPGSAKKPAATRIRLQKKQSKLKPVLPFIHPPVKKITLSVFRRLFSILNTRYGSVETKGEIPTLHFVRAMQRFAIIIGHQRKGQTKKDKEKEKEERRKLADDDDVNDDTAANDEVRESFRSYDVDNSGTVGWWEFVSAWNNNSYAVNHTFMERIFLTIDDQTSSVVGWIVSSISLSMIIVSSLCFVIATLPSLQVQSDQCRTQCTPPFTTSLQTFATTAAQKAYCDDNCEPQQPSYFYQLEVVCVVVFSMEYFARLFTCHAVRSEYLNDELLIDMVLGDQSLRSKSRRDRVLSFMTQPPNVVDALAIMPFYIELLAKSDDMRGSVILRVIRLIRLVRLMKTVKYFEQLRIMSRVIKRAMPGLSVLFFYLCLIVVFAGSLMFHAEAGRWNSEDEQFERYNWQSQAYERSPFTSIPQSFWWTVVTLTTVGYGDMVPMTLLGQFLGAATIFLGVLVLAMPISVLSSSFSETWREWHEERRLSAAHEAEEREAIEAALAFRDPIQQFHKVSIDLYDEDQDGDHDFLGEADLELEDIGSGPWEVAKHAAGREVHYRDITLNLQPNDYKIVGTKRKEIGGQLDVRVWWEPVNGDPGDPEKGENTRASEPYEYTDATLYPGTLWLKVIRARGVRNADETLLSRTAVALFGKDAAACLFIGGSSDPYARITYWPFLPSKQGIIEEVVCKTKTIQDTEDPVWDAEFPLQYYWDPAQAMVDQDEQDLNSNASGPQMASTRVSGQVADPSLRGPGLAGSPGLERLLAPDGESLMIGQLNERSLSEIEQCVAAALEEKIHGLNATILKTLNNGVVEMAKRARTRSKGEEGGPSTSSSAGAVSSTIVQVDGGAAAGAVQLPGAVAEQEQQPAVIVNPKTGKPERSVRDEILSLRKDVRKFNSDLNNISQQLTELLEVVGNSSTATRGAGSRAEQPSFTKGLGFD